MNKFGMPGQVVVVKAVMSEGFQGIGVLPQHAEQCFPIEDSRAADPYAQVVDLTKKDSEVPSEQTPHAGTVHSAQSQHCAHDPFEVFLRSKYISHESTVPVQILAFCHFALEHKVETFHRRDKAHVFARSQPSLLLQPTVQLGAGYCLEQAGYRHPHGRRLDERALRLEDAPIFAVETHDETSIITCGDPAS